MCPTICSRRPRATGGAPPARPSRSFARIARRAAGVLGIVLLQTTAMPAQPAVSCRPSDGELCRLLTSEDFLAAYRGSYRQSVDPADAIDDVRFNMRRVLTGSGHAGPAAVGQQIDAMLDDALRRAQEQLCGPNSDASRAASAVAAGLAGAAAARGAQLSGEMLGVMTGALLGPTRSRGPACLCGARTFDAIRSTCSAG
jgi:hypothetical protein